MRLDFEQGVAMGQALEQIREHSSRIEDHETRLDTVENKVRLAESWIGRGITAAGLWAAGAGLNVSAESVGQMIARVLR